MVVGGRQIGGEEALTRGRRSRAASPSTSPPNGVLTPTGGQNLLGGGGASVSKDDVKSDDARKTDAPGAKNTWLGVVTTPNVTSPSHHHAPPIDPDLRPNGDHVIGSSSGHSHHASHHLLPPPSNHHHHHHGHDSDSDAESDSGMRIGDDYQAVIPEFTPESNPDSSHGAMLIWAPEAHLNDQKLDEYTALAKEKYGYNTEQALGMLFWHKYDVDRAMNDLANFTPYPDDWSVEDKVLFEQAFSFHGKSFHRIRQMLPDKSIASLVKYYYSWKKTRYRSSLMDRQARKLHAGSEEDTHGVDENANSGSKESSEISADEDANVSGTDSVTKSHCSNCAVATRHLLTTSKGSQLCGICYSYWRRTGIMRSTIGPTRRPAHGHGSAHRDDSVLFNKGAAKANPPKDMNLNQVDLDLFTIGPPPSIVTASQNSPSDSQPQQTSSQIGSQGAEGVLKSLESDVIALRRQVQSNKQVISQHKFKMHGPSAVAVASETLQSTGMQEGLDALLSANSDADATFAALSRVSMRWSNDELMLAVQGVREHGQDFKAIAEVLGTKSEAQVRSFYANYKRRYHLDDVYAEFLASSRKNDEGEANESAEKMVTDELARESKSTSSSKVSTASPKVDLKDESNSSDSFISAADAMELNEKLEERRAAKRRATSLERTPPKETALSASPEPKAPDTPDSSSEPTPTARRSGNGSTSAPVKTGGVAAAKNAKLETTIRPTRTSIAKTTVTPT